MNLPANKLIWTVDTASKALDVSTRHFRRMIDTMAQDGLIAIKTLGSHDKVILTRQDMIAIAKFMDAQRHKKGYTPRHLVTA